MIKKICVGSTVLMLIHAVALQAGNPQYNNLTGTSDSIPVDFFYSNFDRNLDSLMRIWYVQESIGSDTLVVELATDQLSFVTELHDSVYIQRLQKIPSLVNLTYNNVVRNCIQTYTNRRRDQMEVMLGLKNYYFPMFEEILDFYELPLELKYLAVIESALNPRARSRVGATGIWQFMMGTGRVYTLKVNTFIDERCDPVAATHAAAKYLKDLYSIYGDWTLAIAAYNCGAGNVNKAVRRSGGKTSYWDIYPYLPRETRGYVPLYIGAAYAMNYYAEHGLTPRSISLPTVTDTIIVNRNVNLSQVAEVLRIPLQLLRDINPQYTRGILPGNAAPCPLRLPASYAARYIDMEDSICKHKENVYLSNMFRTVEPVRATNAATSTADKNHIVHNIRSGETLGGIAMTYGVSTRNLQAWNNLYGSKIVAGGKLVIYTSSMSTKVQTSTVASADRQLPSSFTVASVSGDVIYHTVKSGDTVWDIAKMYDGVSDSDILKWNNLTINSKIKPGMRLIIIQ